MPGDWDDADLAIRARELIRGGGLPAVRPSVHWDGPGSGRECALCGKRISHDQRENEMEVLVAAVSRDNYVLHAQCYLVWDLERRKIESSDAAGH
jgi:hypothetical protein